MTSKIKNVHIRKFIEVEMRLVKISKKLLNRKDVVDIESKVDISEKQNSLSTDNIEQKQNI